MTPLRHHLAALSRSAGAVVLVPLAAGRKLIRRSFLLNEAGFVEGGRLFSVSSKVEIGFVLEFGNPLRRGGSVHWRELGFSGRFAF